MKSDEQAVLDERLAALKSALDRVYAPPLKTGTAITEPTAQAPAAAYQPVRRNRRPLLPVTLGAAASLAIALLALTRPWSAVEPALEPPKPVPAAAAASIRGDYLAAPVLVPVAVHSATRGPELHYLDARIVRDYQGNTRVVFVGSIREE